MDITRHAVDVLPEGGIEAKLKLERPLRVKLGVDPTSPDVHLGFAYVLDRLADFQRGGHTVVLIVGDYTARIGDPSGLSRERPILDDDVLDANAQYFAEQAFRVLDREKTEVRFNGEWLRKLSYADTVRLARTMTVARLLEREDFAKRFEAHVPISLSELLYPIMQAYDSVAIEADIEIGGTDQLFNLLAGRDVMPQYGLEPQIVVTFPLLVGTDGELKMSKSRGNYIGITDPAEEMFGKVMSIPDKALPQWWEMLADGEHPPDALDWKLELARRITARWHGEDGAAGRRSPFHAGCAARRGPRGRPRARSRRGRSGAPAEADRRRRAGLFDERGASPDRPGGGQAERRGRLRARPAAGGSRGRAAAGRQAPLRPLDTVGKPAILLRPSGRAA